MLTQKEIDLELTNTAKRFYSKQYDGELPPNLVELFKKAYMTLAPQNDQMLIVAVRRIISLRDDELNMWEVGMIINTIIAASREKVFSSLEECLDVMEGVEKLRSNYNKMTKEFTDSMERRKKKLMELAGIKQNTKILSVAQ